MQVRASRCFRMINLPSCVAALSFVFGAAAGLFLRSSNVTWRGVWRFITEFEVSHMRACVSFSSLPLKPRCFLSPHDMPVYAKKNIDSAVRVLWRTFEF